MRFNPRWDRSIEYAETFSDANRSYVVCCMRDDGSCCCPRVLVTTQVARRISQVVVQGVHKMIWRSVLMGPARAADRLDRGWRQDVFINWLVQN